MNIPGVKSLKDRVGRPVFLLLHRWGISPNALTLTGLGVNIVSGVLLAKGFFTLGGFFILFAGAFDVLDGGVARVRGGQDRFGAFLDSMIDRYSDLVLLIGVLLYYAEQGSVAAVGLCCITAMGAALVPYARARAECFLPKCAVGLMERPERILLLAAGALSHKMIWAMGLLAVLTHITVIQRIYFCRQHLPRSGEEQAEGS